MKKYPKWQSGELGVAFLVANYGDFYSEAIARTLVVLLIDLATDNF